MVSINEGYNLKCKDSIGGIKSLYLFSYEKHNRSSIRIVNNELKAFPSAIIYKFNTLKNGSFSETMELGGNGEAFTQTINITFSQIGSTYNFEKLRKGYLRAIVEDNNGVFWLLGAYNGLEVKSYTKQTGGSKQELNGYTLTIEGKERVESPFMLVLSPLFGSIDNLFLSSSSLPSSISKKSSDKFI